MNNKKLAGDSFIKSCIVTSDENGIVVETSISNISEKEAVACLLSLAGDIFDNDLFKLRKFYISATAYFKLKEKKNEK